MGHLMIAVLALVLAGLGGGFLAGVQYVQNQDTIAALEQARWERDQAEAALGAVCQAVPVDVLSVLDLQECGEN